MIRFSNPTNTHEAVKKYLNVRNNQYLEISNTLELYSCIKSIIEIDLYRWIVDEEANIFIKDSQSSTRETLMQRMLKVGFEKSLYMKGFRDKDIKVFREVQNTKGSKPDFVINYGSVGTVIVEIKRASNPEIQGKEAKNYQQKMKSYLNSNQADYGILLIMRDDKKKPSNFQNLIEHNSDLYQNSNIEVMAIDCTF